MRSSFFFAPGTFGKRDLAVRVFLLVGLGVAVPVAILGIMSASGLEGLSGQILADREAWARGIADRLDASLRESLQSLQETASAQRFDPQDPDLEPERAALRDAYSRAHSTDSLFLLDVHGQLLLEEPAPGREPGIERLPAVSLALRSGRPAISGLVQESGAARFYALVPVRSWHGTVVGVIGLGSDARRFKELLQAARPSAEGSADLLDIDGNVLVSTGPAPPQELAAHTPLIRDLVQKKRALVGTCASCHADDPALSDRHEVLATAALSSAPWVVRTRQPETPALAVARTLPRNILWTGLALLVVALGFAAGAAQSLRRPLAVLTESAEHIAGGELDSPIPHLGEDEAGRLGRSLERMRVALRASMARVEQANVELEQRVDERTGQLAQANSALRERDEMHAQLLHKVITAQEDERRRIARELHDETSQSLAALMLRLDTALSATPAGEPRRALEEVKSLAVRTLEEVHRLVLDLRPSVLDDLGLASAIRWIADRHLTPAGIASRCELDIERRLSPEAETSLFRVAQEAITNIARHAKAESVLVQLSEHDGKVTLEIEDDGEGFDVEAVSRPDRRRKAFGLMGMRERLELMGGRVTIESSPGQGTRIVAEVPVGREGAA